MKRLFADMQFNQIDNGFFRNRAIFKKEIPHDKSGNTVIIPKREHQSANMGHRDKVNALYIGLDSGDALFDERRSIISSGDSLSVTVPKQFISMVDDEYVQIILVDATNKDALNLAEQVTELGGYRFFAKTMIYKGALSGRRGADEENPTIQSNIPMNESEFMGIESGDNLNVSIVELDRGERVTLKNRAKFRTSVVSGATTSAGRARRKFTVPKPRADIRGYESGQIVQVLARPTFL